jgi:WD40 repeat protein
MMFLLVILMAGVIRVQAQQPYAVDVFSDGGPFDFSADGRYMVAYRAEWPAEIDETTTPNIFIDLFQMSDFSRLVSYDVPDDDIEFVSLSHDARLIAFVQLGGLYLLDRQTGAVTKETANYYEFEALDFSPVNNLLAYVIGRGITVFDPFNPQTEYQLIDNVYGGTIASLAWSPDGRYLANGVYRAGSDTFDVLLWDMPSLQESIIYEPTFALEGAEPNDVAWRDAHTLAAFGASGVMIYDISTRSLITLIPNPPNLVWSRGTWSPDGTQLIASGGNRAATQPTPVIQSWDVSNLPAYETISYQEGTIGAELHWISHGLFYASRGGLRLNGEFLAPQLTATAQVTPSPTHTLTPTPALTPAPFQRLRLTSLCSANPAAYRLWRIRNSNPVDVVFTWDVYRSPTGQNGFGVAPPAVNGVASEVIISTVAEAGANTLRLFVDGAQQDVKASPEHIIAWYAQRWSVEVTFEEVRAHLGFETQRQWNALAIARSSPALLGLFSLVTWLAHQLLAHPGDLPIRSTA